MIAVRMKNGNNEPLRIGMKLLLASGERVEVLGFDEMRGTHGQVEVDAGLREVAVFDGCSITSGPISDREELDHVVKQAIEERRKHDIASFNDEAWTRAVLATLEYLTIENRRYTSTPDARQFLVYWGVARAALLAAMKTR